MNWKQAAPDHGELGALGLDAYPLLTAGVDEAGRGPLAGPVVAAAVILDPARPIDGLRDSKKLTAKRRAQLFRLIRERALCWSVARASVREIDDINILEATMLAMRRAVLYLRMRPELALIDGNRAPLLPCESKVLVGGDDLEPAISAASIMAKECRDRLMLFMDKKYPDYGFALHKGYGTAAHLAALRQHGPSRIHRRSFAPVSNLIK